MNPFNFKLKSVSEHFNEGDISLGYRILIDCVLDSQSLEMYKECIELADWKEANPANENEFIEKANILVGKLSGFDIKVNDNAVLLSAENISKSYGNNKFRLDNISLSLKSGEVFGMVGENGNGKTTLLRILAGEINFDSGTLSYPFENENLSDYDLLTRLVYIPQRTPKWYGSLRDNLKYAASHYGIKGEENELMTNMMIIRFGLWSFRNHQWDELSSGYKMRFELARTFLRKPKILFLDEPLANLDILAQQLILKDLKNLSQSLSNPIGVVLSSQQLFEVEKISDKILFLKNGHPTHLSDKNEEEQGMSFIELDIDCTKPRLLEVLEGIKIKKIDFNGGMYLLSIEEAEGFNRVLSVLIQNNIKIKYARDISQSTKRLFA